MSSSKVPVEELQRRADEEFPVSPGTNEEAALRHLAVNADTAYRPRALADETEIAPNSVGKTLDRLYRKGLLDRHDGYYFVVQERVDEIRGVLGDLHNAEMAAADAVAGPPDTDGDDPIATADEVDELVDEVASTDSERSETR